MAKKKQNGVVERGAVDVNESTRKEYIIPAPEPLKRLIVRGARTHNLKNISLELPRNRLIIITGVSGSGKSSLAFDTIFAEGQRRYVESLSSYARQFLERMAKPDVDLIQGVSPAVAIEQRVAPRNPRSTVGTMTEVYDYLRLLFARAGVTICYNCGAPVRKDSVSSATERIMQLPEGTKLYILFPLHSHESASLESELDNLRSAGYARIVLRGHSKVMDLNEELFADTAPRIEKENIRILADRLVVKNNEAFLTRLSGSIETAFSEAEGVCIVMNFVTGEEMRFSSNFECAQCGIIYTQPEPRLFSFNNPYGACPECQGFGKAIGVDLERVIPDHRKSIRDGAIHPFTTPKHAQHWRTLIRVARELKIDVDTPYSMLGDKEKDFILNGHGEYIGVLGFFKMLDEHTYNVHYRVLASRYRGYTSCPKCNGSRLRHAALNVHVADKTIFDIVRMSIAEARDFFATLTLSAMDAAIAGRVLTEIQKRLKYLNDVGIGYLTLERLSNTLSGGETQRINLATALGSALVGATYVLDEPSIGLHPRDVQMLIGVLQSLRNLGNTVIVVEHDKEIIDQADFLVDIGPGAGEHGGNIIAAGPAAEVRKNNASLTAQYLNGTAKIPIPERRHILESDAIHIKNAYEHNLKHTDVTIPLHAFVCITGVSGSGKSTLVHEVLYANLKRAKEGFSGAIGKCDGITGADSITHVELVDQTPIGRTPRSNPISYIHVFDIIRDVFAATAYAQARGWKSGHFSFNVPGGRCEACQGDGVVKVEMQFLADLYLTCESCKGTRYKLELSEATYRGKSIVEVLEMTVSEALHFFEGNRRIISRLKVLEDVGLGYIRLGQPATTLSGGEAQRIKLASYLSGELTGNTLFIFDEPTTGLHFADIATLLKCFNALIDKGHSLVVIEHNLDVIKCADHVIDLGPDAGDAGGYVVATGTPEAIAKVKKSYTGSWLKEYLAKE